MRRGSRSGPCTWPSENCKILQSIMIMIIKIMEIKEPCKILQGARLRLCKILQHLAPPPTRNPGVRPLLTARPPGATRTARKRPSWQSWRLSVSGPGPRAA